MSASIIDSMGLIGEFGRGFLACTVCAAAVFICIFLVRRVFEKNDDKGFWNVFLRCGAVVAGCVVFCVTDIAFLYQGSKTAVFSSIGFCVIAFACKLFFSDSADDDIKALDAMLDDMDAE